MLAEFKGDLDLFQVVYDTTHFHSWLERSVRVQRIPGGAGRK